MKRARDQCGAKKTKPIPCSFGRFSSGWIAYGFLLLSLAVGACEQFEGPAGPDGVRTTGRQLHPAANITVIDLDLGRSFYRAYGINETGQVVGQSLHAFLWQNGTITDLGTLGGSSSLALGINDAGQVVGYSYTTGNAASHAFLWQNGTMIDLGTLGGSSSEARDINDAGQVVGSSTKAGNFPRHAFLWQNGTMTDLGTLHGSFTVAHGVNDAGQVVGESATVSGGRDAFLWQNGTMTNLGNLGGSGWTVAFDINDAGQVVGYSYTAGSVAQRAFLWQNGTMTDLGTLGGSHSRAYGINNLGQVVGVSYTAGNAAQHGFLWENGTMTDLGTLGGTTSEALGINDAGQIVGESRTADGGPHATMWILGPATPQEAITNLMAQVQALADQGTLDKGEANSLQSKLEAAAKLIGREAYEPAANLLMAFVNEVEALVQSGRLTTAQGQPLIDAGQELAERLQSS